MVSFHIQRILCWDLHCICKNIFACLFRVHDIISFSRHEQVYLSRLQCVRNWNCEKNEIAKHSWEGNHNFI